VCVENGASRNKFGGKVGRGAHGTVEESIPLKVRATPLSVLVAGLSISYIFKHLKPVYTWEMLSGVSLTRGS
jgi:hypothetical protein